jgi:hypothetical protein
MVDGEAAQGLGTSCPRALPSWSPLLPTTQMMERDEGEGKGEVEGRSPAQSEGK